jgi:hypothetical protein
LIVHAKCLMSDRDDGNRPEKSKQRGPIRGISPLTHAMGVLNMSPHI